jgi:ATP-dependent RNA helicase DDX19/DBP5
MDCKDEEDKYRVLLQLYHVLTIGSSIIFVRVKAESSYPPLLTITLTYHEQRRDTADRIQARLEADGHKVAALHSALETTAQRDKVIDDFRFGRAKVLITT